MQSAKIDLPIDLCGQDVNDAKVVSHQRAVQVRRHDAGCSMTGIDSGDEKLAGRYLKLPARRNVHSGHPGAERQPLAPQTNADLLVDSVGSG